jgi:hypothetical protein
MKVRHEAVISEYNGNRKNTIGLNDLTIIALAKTLGLPVEQLCRGTYLAGIRTMQKQDTGRGDHRS